MTEYESGYDAKYGYNKNAFAPETKTIGTRVMGLVMKGITTPIGLVSEAVHDYRDGKNTQSPSTVSASGAADGVVYVNVSEDQARDLISSGQGFPADGHTPTHELIPEEPVLDHVDRDEADWELDEVSSSQDAEAASSGDLNIQSMVREIQSSSEQGSSNSRKSKNLQTGSKLPFPVIVPQRRPGQKNRGFVRAYAPVLEDMGIDQPMFLSFIANLQKAAQASPILDVLVLATSLAAFYPEPTIGLGLQAAQVALAIAQEAQERWKTNRFLEQANKEIFMPHGLFAMLVTYKPVSSNAEPEISTKTIDLGAQAVAKYGGSLLMNDDNSGDGENKNLSDMKNKVQQRLRVSSGKVEGDAQMPVECAPLIFPAIEEQAMKTKRDGKNETLARWQSKSKNASIWMGDYFDRRAQASFAFRNPDSKLASNSAPVNFKSRFADPNNHMNLHFFTLITGGLYKAEPLGAKRRWESAKRKEAAKRAQGQKVKSSKRLLSEDILYLQIVNMPTTEELEKAKQELNKKFKAA